MSELVEGHHTKFLERLGQSNHGVNVMTEYLNNRGMLIVRPPVMKSPTYDDRAGYADFGDFYYAARGEVKQVSTPFGENGDGWKHHRFMVCSVSSFEKARPTPKAYWILSPCSKYFAKVSVTTKPHWTRDWVLDTKLNQNQEFYFVPFKYIKWGKV